MFRFVHSSDLHLGKRFGNLPEELRGRLREARHEAIGRLAAKARAFEAGTILLAGDTFDSETPSPATLRQALTAMAAEAPLRWVILPGNHDSLRADELWSTARAALPDNVILATEAAPLELAAGVALLPAPCTTRRPGRDLTAWMDAAATPEGTIRLGLAHGAIQHFSEEGGALDIIAPDRPARAGLDYLALGDWHGQMKVGPACWYSGTPEPDRFKHGAPGSALVVTLAGSGAPPEVSSVAVAGFEWRTLALELGGGPAPEALLAAELPDPAARRRVLLRVAASGRAHPQERAALEAALASVGPEFAHAVLDTAALSMICDLADLDAIDTAGALREAAERLLAESADPRLAPGERGIAGEALARLFAYCGERAA